jgi:flagellar biosynthesis anti-sigma factor FlgM
LNTPNINRLHRVPGTEQGVQSPEPRKSGISRNETKDQVSISNQAQEALRLREIVTNAADIRADKVDALRSSIAQGTYDVPALDIAAKMLGISGDKE